ncbi:lysophospholipase [Mrakia frigida]|uniref:lysophospholipase n=1 Tax=Mrakia frigida TaxID=29902 RepID=UPI003FCC2354
MNTFSSTNESTDLLLGNEDHTLKTIYYSVPPASVRPKDLFRGLSPFEPPVPSRAWLLVEPILTYFKLYTPPDSTYGRYLIPPLPEEEYLDSSSLVETTQRRIFTDAVGGSENVSLTQEEVESGRGRSWVYWKSWELEDRKGKIGEGVDLLVVHGIGDYGTRWSIHIGKFISQGFRVIAPDLPAHGHSSEIHCYVPSIHHLTESIRLVIADVAELDASKGREKAKKMFISGASLGAFVGLSYLLDYPPADPRNPKIEGAFFMCPLITISAASRPSKTIENIARVLEPIAGRLPVAQAQRGKGHVDPRVEISFLLNPQTYHGPLRISTGMEISRAVVALERRAPEITVPFKVIHGKQDRITSPEGSQEWFSRCMSKDQTVELWDGYEHVMNKVGYDKEDDEPRQRVLNSWFDWVAARV